MVRLDPSVRRMTAHSPVRPDPVATFMPWAKPDERDIRRRVLAFQQRAGTRARQCNQDRARSLWWLINSLAGETAFAPMPPVDLEEVLTTLTRLALCAGAIERWEASDGD